MSHREHVTYFISATPKNSESVNVFNEHASQNVSIHSDNFIRIYGQLDDYAVTLLNKHFHVYDKIENYELLAE